MDWFYLLLIINFEFITSSVVISENEECELDPKLVEEIKSYENVTRFIMNKIINDGYGDMMYEKYTKFIDKFGARPSGTENLEHAIDHMVNLTIQHGLNDVTTEEVAVPHWVRGEESAKMIHPYHKNIALLGIGTSVSTPPEGLTAEAIIINSFDELDKTDESKVNGKIVVFDAHYTTYGNTVTYRGDGATKASEKGAIASLIRSITPLSIYSPHTGDQTYGENVTKIPTACITIEDADLLRRLQDQGEKIIITLKMSNTFDEKTSRNTIVDLKGKDNPEKTVIVSGHIDSWDVGQGAMDDGGGMMISWFAPVVLNMLKLKPRRTVRAILWTAEEFGYIGAAAYLKKYTDDLPNINFIMESDEGTFKPLGLEAAGSKTALCIIKEVLKLFSPIDKLTKSDYPGSDIALLIAKGVPGAALLNKNERYYWFHHTEGDTMNVQNKDDVIECAAFWAAISYVIADLSVDIPRN